MVCSKSSVIREVMSISTHIKTTSLQRLHKLWDKILQIKYSFISLTASKYAVEIVLYEISKYISSHRCQNHIKISEREIHSWRCLAYCILIHSKL